MKGLVEYVAKSLVDDPLQVSLREISGRNSLIIELSAAPEDMGKIIGRRGRTVNAIRALLRASATKQGKRVTLEIVDKSRS
jgi:predicted RNA-binding protein YlqC (UPF0109 family)